MKKWLVLAVIALLLALTVLMVAACGQPVNDNSGPVAVLAPLAPTTDNQWKTAAPAAAHPFATPAPVQVPYAPPV